MQSNSLFNSELFPLFAYKISSYWKISMTTQNGKLIYYTRCMWCFEKTFLPGWWSLKPLYSGFSEPDIQDCAPAQSVFIFTRIFLHTTYYYYDEADLRTDGLVRQPLFTSRFRAICCDCSEFRKIQFLILMHNSSSYKLYDIFARKID